MIFYPLLSSNTSSKSQLEQNYWLISCMKYFFGLFLKSVNDHGLFSHVLSVHSGFSTVLCRLSAPDRCFVSFRVGVINSGRQERNDKARVRIPGRDEESPVNEKWVCWNTAPSWWRHFLSRWYRVRHNVNRFMCSFHPPTFYYFC